MSDQQTIDVYNDQVETYTRMVDSEKPGTALIKFTEAIPVGGKVLDLGCGPGNSAAYFSKNGLDVDAVDASPEMVRKANETYKIAARVAVFDDLQAKAEYDGIWANFSLLHAPKADFPRHLKQIGAALKPHGYFHIGMKLGSGELRDRIGRLYTYYTEEELQKHLENAGFHTVWKKAGEEAGLSGEISPFAVILTQKQVRISS